jgi:hypothetical protein
MFLAKSNFERMDYFLWWRGSKPLWNPWKGMVAQLEQAGGGKTKWEIYLFQVPANIRFMWTYSLSKLSGDKN